MYESAGMTRDVFISYSQPDHACAFELVNWVESHGIRCWIAPRDIAPAADWAAEIIDAIAAARVLVLVFSAHSNDSPQVRREVERATHKRVTILPFRMENVLPSKSLEYFLSTQHWLDAFPPPLAPHYQRLCEHLRVLLAAPPGAAPDGATSTRGTPASPASPSAGSTANTGAWAYASPGVAGLLPEQLRLIEKELAAFIGPIARRLVQLAMGRAATREHLIALLAAELESESERRDFEQRCNRV